jgi:hypothetical protein
MQIRHEFITFAPDVLELGVVYISMEYATVLHTCCCGCGNKVVTPIAPGRWHLTFDGETISLNHSIGNWSFPCQSHYWIERNKVIWDRAYNRSAIDRVRAADQRAMQSRQLQPVEDAKRDSACGQEKSWWRRVLKRFQK